VITDCEGVINDSTNNSENESYQECYEKKGFSTLRQYWSSTSYTYPDHPDYPENLAWFVGFYLGDKDLRVKPTYYYIRCIKN